MTLQHARPLVLVVTFLLSFGLLATAAEPVAGSPRAVGRIAPDVVGPRSLARVAPVYPDAALGTLEDASVVAAVAVRADGSVADVSVAHASREGLGFEEAALDAVKQWQFRPAQRAGEPVESFTLVQLNFHAPNPDISSARDIVTSVVPTRAYPGAFLSGRDSRGRPDAWFGRQPTVDRGGLFAAREIPRSSGYGYAGTKRPRLNPTPVKAGSGMLDRRPMAATQQLRAVQGKSR